MNNPNFLDKFKIYLKKNKINFLFKIFAVAFYNFKSSFGQLINYISKKCCVFQHDEVIKPFSDLIY